MNAQGNNRNDRPPNQPTLSDVFFWSILDYIEDLPNVNRNRDRRDRIDRHNPIVSNLADTPYDETNPAYNAHYITTKEYGIVERAYQNTLILTKQNSSYTITYAGSYTRYVFIAHDQYVARNHGRHGHAYAPRFVIHPLVFLALLPAEQNEFRDRNTSFALYAQYDFIPEPGSPFGITHPYDGDIAHDILVDISFVYPSPYSRQRGTDRNNRYELYQEIDDLSDEDLDSDLYNSRQQRSAWTIIPGPIAHWIRPRNFPNWTAPTAQTEAHHRITSNFL
jgi:hypothetical protein